MKYAKQNKLAAELVDELRKRVSNYIITEGFDSNGWPTILLAADSGPATTEDVVFIRVRPRDWNLAKDIIGNDQVVYTPSVIQVAVEGPTSGKGLGRYVSAIHLFSVLTTCSKRGTRLEYWEEPNGDDPDVTTFTDASNMITSIEPDLDWPLLSSQ